jgi:hypothetical protein
MKPTLQNCKDTFKFSYDAYESSRLEQKEIVDLYHNRHYTNQQLNTLTNRGQPKETFNIIKMYHRLMVGYFNTVVNNVKVSPVGSIKNTSKAAMAQDVVNTEFRINKFKKLIPRWASDMLLRGICVSYMVPEDSGKKDRFGRSEIRLNIEKTPADQFLSDPLATKADYSDGRFTHRFRWMAEEEVDKLFGKGTSKTIPENTNTEQISDYELADKYNQEFVGEYQMWNHYLIINTVMQDGDKTWSMFWCEDTMIKKVELKYDNVKWNYRPFILEENDKAEIYGPFRELVETQKAINQALLQIQLLVNSDKVLVQDSALQQGDLNTFETQYNRVNAIIKVADVNGVKVINLSTEVIEQYRILDAALDRVQKVLNINDAFMGTSMASDSGRKVRLQQNSSISSMNYLTEHLEFILEELARDIANHAKQYYTSERVLRVTDESTADRWLELNKPFEMPNGQVNEDGTLGTELMYRESLSEDGTPEQQEDGSYTVEPIVDQETTLDFDELDIAVTSNSFNDSDDIERLTLETIVQGPAGTFLMNARPAAFAKVLNLHVKALKSRHSEEIAEIFSETAQMLEPAQTRDPRDVAAQQGQGGGEGIGALTDALGATNDAQPAGYNQGAQ